MAKSSGRWVVIAFASAGLAAALVSWLSSARGPAPARDAIPDAGMVEAALRALPADSYAIATIPDLTGYARSFRATAFGEMVNDPQVQEAARALLAPPGASEATSALGGVLESFGELGAMGLRSLAIAVYPLPGAGAGAPIAGFGTIIACDHPERVVLWFDARTETADGQPENAGNTTTPASKGNINGTEFECRNELCRATRGNAFYLAWPAAALERLLTNPSASASTTAGQPRLRQAIERSGASPTGFFAFVDLLHLTAAARQYLAHDGQAVKLFSLLHIDALDSLALSETVDGELFHDHLLLTYQPDKAGLLGALLAPPARELVLDRALPGDVTTAWFGSLPDFAQAWDLGVAELRAGTPEAELAGIEQVISTLNAQLGFDLRNDLLGAIGGEAGFAWSADPAPAAATSGVDESRSGGLTRALLSSRILLMMGVRDPLRAEKLIQVIEQSIRARSIPVTVAALGAGKLWTIALGDDPARHPSIALFDDRMVFTTRGEDLRGLIAETTKPVAGDTLYQTMRARVGGAATLVSWSKTSGTFKDLLLSVAAGTPAPESPATLSADLAELGSRVDRHLNAMPPSLAVGRGGAGLLEYQTLTPFNVGIASALMIALAVPQVEDAASTRAVDRSMVALRSITFACEAYAVEHGRPPVAASLAEARALLEPTWTTALPETDAWGHGIEFKSDEQGYVIASAGADGKFELDWTATCLGGCPERAGTTAEPSDDLVVASGQFLRAPAPALQP